MAWSWRARTVLCGWGWLYFWQLQSIAPARGDVVKVEAKVEAADSSGGELCQPYEDRPRTVYEYRTASPTNPRLGAGTYDLAPVSGNLTSQARQEWLIMTYQNLTLGILSRTRQSWQERKRVHTVLQKKITAVVLYRTTSTTPRMNIGSARVMEAQNRSSSPGYGKNTSWCTEEPIVRSGVKGSAIRNLDAALRQPTNYVFWSHCISETDPAFYT